MKTSVKSIMIIATETKKCMSGNGSYIDFYISINGQEPDADLYRIYSWENEFHKILGFTSYGHAIRGNARKLATELILGMRQNGLRIGYAEA